MQIVRAEAVYLQRSLNLQRLRIDKEGYLRRIDAMVYGEEPRQGYVAEGMFFHPDLCFQSPVPEDWKMSHTPTQVQMVSKDEDAVILFAVTGGSSSKDAARTFVTETRANVARADGLEVSGFISG